MIWRGAGRIGLLVGTVAVVGCAQAGPQPRVPAPARTSATTIGEPQNQDNATGAVATLTADQVGGQHVNLVDELFKSRFAGVFVDGGRVHIRGVQNAAGGPEPLLILDGMPTSGGVLAGLRGLNPTQIESIQVLKDVSSTAIYGTRAAGGVIIVRMRND